MVNHNQVLFGLFVALALAGNVLGTESTCTPESCADVVVQAHFLYSNCSGEVTYTPVYRNWGVCSAGYKSEQNEYGFIDMQFYGDALATCDADAENGTYVYYGYRFGACIVNEMSKRDERGGGLARHHALSFMYLPNYNATSSYTSPQDFDNQPLPAYIEASLVCPEVDNCTLDNGEPSQMWSTHYSSLNCQNTLASYSNPYTLPNTCYNFNNVSYQLKGCIDDHTSYTAHFSDADCSLPSTFTLEKAHCGPSSTTTKYCTATRTEIPSFAPPPPSASPASTESPDSASPDSASPSPASPSSASPTSPDSPTSSSSCNQISFFFALVACTLAMAIF